MQVLLDPSNIESAVQLVTKVDGHKVSLQVIMHRVKKDQKLIFCCRFSDLYGGVRFTQ